MLIQPLKRILSNVAGKTPLRTVLIVPFVLQIVGAVGLVGYLSFRNGQQAVNDVASQLRGELSDRTSDRIKTYLTTPHLINLTNADAIRLGQLNIKNPKALERHFFKQIQVFNSLSRIYFSNPQGGLISVGNDERGLTVAFTENFASGVLRVKGLDSQGDRQKLLVNQQNYDARERPFYQKAIEVGKATWTPIYIYVPTSRGLGIAASNPFYDQEGKFQGVLSSDLSLVAINNFLQSLKIGTQGKAFIIDRSGMIVASSSPELPFISSADGKEKKRLKATEMKNPLIRATAQQLISYFGKLTNINAPKQLEFEIEGKRQFAQVTPFNDELGLDWLIVVVVPESDFMERINANTYTTILLCAATLIVATGIGIITAHWITKPILRLNTAAQKISQGEWSKTVEINRSDEVGQLAKSFNSMAAQLQTSFAAVRKSENRLIQFLEVLPVGVSVHDVTGKLTYANPISKQLMGIDTLPNATTEQLATTYFAYLSGTEQLYPVEQMPVVKALLGESSTVEDMELHRPDKIIPLEVRATPIYDETGEIVSAIAAFIDITERKQAQQILAEYNHTLEIQVSERTAELRNINEQLGKEIIDRQQVEKALRESEERFREIAGTINQLFFIHEAVSGQFLYISPAYEKIWGRSCESLYQDHKLWMEALHPDDRQLILNSLAKQFQGNAVKREYRIIHTDGSIRWIAAEISVVRDENGQAIRFVGLAEDVSERKRVEAEIIRSKDLLESIFNESADAIFLVNAETLLITDCNLRAVEMFEAQSKDELLNIEGETLQKEPFIPGELQSIRDEIALYGFWSRELEYFTKKGRLFWGNLAARDISVAGQIIRLVRVTDITAGKLAQQALQESALREQAIAHVLQKMRQTLNIETIFSSTTQELRQVLHCDRVAIYRFNPDWSGKFVAESVTNGWVPLVVQQKNDPSLTENVVEDENCTIKTLDEPDLIQDTYLQETQGGCYAQDINYQAIEDIYKAGFTPCYLNLLERFQAKAYINVPIFDGSKLWGLLATYQNSGSRFWSEAEISVVIQIGVQMGIALQQAELLEETKQQAVALKLAFDELKRTQTQLIQAEKMSSLGQMIAGIAHEINNPVSFIYGNLTPANQYFQDLLELLELYQQTYPNPTPEIENLAEDIDLEFLVEDWSKLMNSMQVGTQRISDIVLSLRNFSRLDEKELKLVDIHEGIDNTLLILQHRLRAEGHRPAIELIKNYGQLPLITCYASQLNQVFMNILSNGIDALEKQTSSRVITISTTVGTENKKFNFPYVVIRIADNGLGMSEEVLHQIFDPFFTTKPVGSGTGLGLSISYQIVEEKHKGQISCISDPGERTEFIVEIPVSPSV
ncbi:MAG: PAS domain S-box protein [Potamolinea sp.]